MNDSDTIAEDNKEIATALLKEIASAADSGNALVLGPQAVKNLRQFIGDILLLAKRADPKRPLEVRYATLVDGTELWAPCNLVEDADVTVRLCDEDTVMCVHPSRVRNRAPQQKDS